MENLTCDCFRPYISPDGDCGKCGYEIMDRRCELCKIDVSPEEIEDLAGKYVCKDCYLEWIDTMN